MHRSSHVAQILPSVAILICAQCGVGIQSSLGKRLGPKVLTVLKSQSSRTENTAALSLAPAHRCAPPPVTPEGHPQNGIARAAFNSRISLTVFSFLRMGLAMNSYQGIVASTSQLISFKELQLKSYWIYIPKMISIPL